ncbi:MAG: hypothetical protein LBM98_13170 [Oscillospiraceae bacterium]|nr:hypothetical protein [Oscillospiraceae bacterium]
MYVALRRGGFQTRPPRAARGGRTGVASAHGAGRRQGLPCPARHCEAPVRPRYVGRYRCEAIQCRGDNIRMYRRCLRQPWIASPHIIDYVS